MRSDSTLVRTWNYGNGDPKGWGNPPDGDPPQGLDWNMWLGARLRSGRSMRIILVHLDRAASESGADLNRLDLPQGVYTGIWWYAKFPEHYAGDGSPATKELGEFDMNEWVKSIAAAIRAVKADRASLRLQNEFFEKSRHPLETKQ
jgi:hypothetical protein